MENILSKIKKVGFWKRWFSSVVLYSDVTSLIRDCYELKKEVRDYKVEHESHLSDIKKLKQQINVDRVNSIMSENKYTTEIQKLTDELTVMTEENELTQERFTSLKKTTEKHSNENINLTTKVMTLEEMLVRSRGKVASFTSEKKKLITKHKTELAEVHARITKEVTDECLKKAKEALDETSAQNDANLLLITELQESNGKLLSELNGLKKSNVVPVTKQKVSKQKQNIIYKALPCSTIKEIRKRVGKGESISKLAIEFKRSESTIEKIFKRETYKKC